MTRTAAAAMAMAKLRQGAAAARPPAPEEDAAPPPAADGQTGPDTSMDTGTDTSTDTGTDRGTATGAASEVEAEIAAIRAEELTGRQLRMAMRVAQKHGIKPTSGLEAVRLLRRQGIDPFEHSTLIDIVKNGPEPGRALATLDAPALPRTVRQPGPPAMPPIPAAAERSAEIGRIQQDIVRRRRRRLALLGARLAVFVMLPTLLAAWYFYMIATPLYATQTEFVIQQADSQASPGVGGGLGGLFSGTGLATSQDSVTVQSYLQSREAMLRLDQDHGFKAHFQAESMDPLRRLATDTTDEAAYRLYRRMVQISYDPTEGIIKMEVIAASPETSAQFSRALIQYAEEQVDQLTQRLRAQQMSDATESFERAEERMVAAQMRVLELQESFQVLSSEVEVTLLTQQITTLETQLNQERLSLADLLANSRPNAARVQQVERRIGALEGQIQAMRSSLTQGEGGGASLARVQRELVMAEADVATRQLMLANSMQQLEAARIEANRQVRYLSMGVSPVAPDESTHPRRFENTALAFLVFAGIYLMISMTVSILREQVTS
ncbi:MAG TPA: capsule biosynthesis protein [Paracoccus sp.]|nr:capsule biosynthesis protein [Paracoccus sp. (in: a-proteobacteria)]